jgi:alpha-N-arabinofuranosidase
VTELQIFTNRPRLPNNATMAEAVWTADITNASIRSEGVVELITHSALVNHGGGLRKRRGIVFANPVWWTTHLYASQDGVIPTAARVESPAFAVPERWGLRGGQVPCLGAAALLNEAGDAWALFVVNRSPVQAVEAEIVLKGFPAGPSAEVITVAGKDCMAANSLESPSTVAPRTSTGSVRDGRLTHAFPPASLTRIVFRRD